MLLTMSISLWSQLITYYIDYFQHDNAPRYKESSVASSITKSESSRRPSGCGWTVEWQREHGADKSAGTCDAISSTWSRVSKESHLVWVDERTKNCGCLETQGWTSTKQPLTTELPFRDCMSLGTFHGEGRAQEWERILILLSDWSLCLFSVSYQRKPSL